MMLSSRTVRGILKYAFFLQICIFTIALSFSSYSVSAEQETQSKTLYYVVKKGDTLYAIANGNFKIPVDTLRQANGLKNDNIKVNQVLKVPYDDVVKGRSEPVQIAQDLPRRREGEKRLEEEPDQSPKKSIQPKTGGEAAEDLPSRRDAPAVPERLLSTDELEAISPDIFIPVSDRWRIGYTRNILNPYKQNVLKGDYPIFGNDIFFAFTGISDTLAEFRELPIPAGISTESSGSRSFFGKDNQYFFRQNFFLKFEIFRGDTAFKPLNWALVFTPAINVPTYLRLEERGGVNIDVTDGVDRTTYDFAVQELFFEYHFVDISDRYDFISGIIGVQPFNADFRGLIFLDSNLGVRLFGDWDNNQWQYNVVFFEMLEKDTNSELNKAEFRDQEVLIANVYKEDFIWKGYTTEFSFLYNHDSGDLRFDQNDFLVRPDPSGDAVLHTLDIAYLGWTSSGHIGRINVEHAVYLAFGHDDRNPIAGRSVNVFGQLGALELSIDYDWLRPKISVFYSSGDSDPTDGTATAFDTIFDKPNFVGGGFSFWNRQGIRLLGVGLVQRESLIPNLRSSKIEGQSNFVNPGIVIVNVGFDIETTPKLRTFLNANYLSFIHTEPLEVFLQQPDIAKSIGFDLSAGIFYRPLNTNNVIITAGVGTLLPGDGFEDLLTKSSLFQGFMNLILQY